MDKYIYLFFFSDMFVYLFLIPIHPNGQTKQMTQQQNERNILVNDQTKWLHDNRRDQTGGGGIQCPILLEL